jgi:hypothetical protein
MKHITFGEKSLLVGDAAADALLEYAAFLASDARGDTVEIRAIGSDGDDVTATFLLGPGATLMAETANTNLPEPDNTAALEYMRNAQLRPSASPTAVSDDAMSALDYDELYGIDAHQAPSGGLDPQETEQHLG